MQFPWAILQIIPCPYCNHSFCIQHGHYSRKGTHLFSEIILVPRFRCGPCGSTHSILPDCLLPICRWWIGDILKIAKCLALGETAYAIAKSLCESLASLVHLKAWIAKAADVIEVLAREIGALDATPPPAPRTSGSRLTLTYLWPTWAAFTYSFSRTLYPKRFPLRSTHTILTG